MFNSRRPFAFVLAVATLLIASCQGAQHTSAPPTVAPAQPAPWYEAEIQAFEDRDSVMPPASGQVLFVGSSSIRMWKSLADDMRPMPVLNRGFGGSKTPEVLAVFDRIVLPYRPSIIVYYCGDNDLGADNTDSQAAADGFIAFAERVHQQWARVSVFYIAIKPSLARWNNWDAMHRANDIVRQYADEHDYVTFLDIATPVLTAGGPRTDIFLGDGLHLNETGYQIWTGVIRPPVFAEWERTLRRH